MEIALKEAQKAFLQDEVPVGAVIVDADGNIIAKAYNKTEYGFDPTAHAEINAIRKACKKLKTKRLWNCCMYVTLEPCTMCAAAISFARIEKLFIGAYDEKGGAVANGVRFFESSACHFNNFCNIFFIFLFLQTKSISAVFKRTNQELLIKS